eukprot:gene5611-191_t
MSAYHPRNNGRGPWQRGKPHPKHHARDFHQRFPQTPPGLNRYPQLSYSNESVRRQFNPGDSSHRLWQSGPPEHHAFFNQRQSSFQQSPFPSSWDSPSDGMAAVSDSTKNSSFTDVNGESIPKRLCRDDFSSPHRPTMAQQHESNFQHQYYNDRIPHRESFNPHSHSHPSINDPLIIHTPQQSLQRAHTSSSIDESSIYQQAVRQPGLDFLVRHTLDQALLSHKVWLRELDVEIYQARINSLRSNCSTPDSVNVQLRFTP